MFALKDDCSACGRIPQRLKFQHTSILQEVVNHLVENPQ